jgi:galactoside O-acetyltransferase
MSYLSQSAIDEIGFLSIGKNVKISSKASIYGPDRISIGSNVRIDDYCIISASNREFRIGSFVHIAAYSLIVGNERVEMMDFSGLSSRVSVYSSSDDYSGTWMTNPTVPDEFTGVKHAPVTIGKHVMVGAGSIILPGSSLEEGVAVGALSLIKGRCKEFGVYFGSPAKRISERKKDILRLESEFLASVMDSKGKIA